MGLLLSVLVACVGVLEVIACVRHFQDGYLPLWTPHCAVTSGYAKTHERWRKKPSDNYEFRSTNDVSGALNHAQDQSSETFLQPDVSVENGYTVKHKFEDTSQEVTPSKEVRQLIDDTFSFENDNRIEDLHETDIISSTLGTEESNLDLISTYDNELNKSPDEYDEQKKITTNYNNPNLISELVDEHPKSIDSQYEVLLNTSDSNIPLSYHSEGNELVLSSNDGSGQVSLSNKDSGFKNRAEEISNILSENQTITEVYNVHKISGEETFQPEILNNPETFKRLEYDFDRPIESIDQRESNKSVFQEEIPQIPSIEEPSQNVQIFSSEVPSSVPKESVVAGRVPHENSKLEIDLTSQHFAALRNNNDSVEESPYVPLSDIEAKNEIPSNIVHKQSLEKTDISSAVAYVPESESEALETEIQEEQSTCLQTKIDSSYDNERPESVDVDEVIRYSRESTPQIFQEYVPLKIDEIKSKNETLQMSEGLEDRNVAGSKPENSIEDSQNTSDTTIIAETSTFQSENRPQQELEEISKYDAFEYLHDNEENEYIQEDKESTPQPILEEDNEEIPKIETTLSLQKDGSGIQRQLSNHSPEPIVMEGEETIKINEKEDTSESRLENQTTSPEFVSPKKENTEQESQVLIPKSEIPKEIHKLRATSPLTIDTSEESPPNSRQTSHQSSMSPPQLPSTPTKKSKADISWPTFFPGAPVIKRPSVSFATPEAIFTNEDQDLLRQYSEEATDITPCIKKSEEIRSVADTEDKTPSSAEDKSLESIEASERSDSFEEDIVPITFKERSPSNIVAGNDFSRKELQLQRKKSFKHKRYSSASELNTREEETEDKSFSENKPSIVRASSLKESRRRYRNPPKASSFEDAMLLEISKTKGEDITLKKTVDTSIIPVIEEKEIESQRDRVVSFNVAKDEIENGGDLHKESNQRNESNSSNLQYERIKEESKLESGSRTEEDEEEREGESSYSASEEQSSSQQKSPAKEAFWLIFSGEYTKAMSKDWHSGHFCCWQCDESLTGQRYVLRDDHPYCIKCYESVFANACEECNKTIGIDSKDLSYKDKHWHEACFLCNKCRVSLVDKQFGSKSDKIYCGNCYDAQFASRCDGCGEIFRAGTKKMEYKTRQWHEKCFCCCVCKSAIGTKSFIPREQEIYCATCYEEKFATRCVKCNKIITSGGVTYKNEPWHRECFTCTNCNTSLAGQRFTSRDEKPYCADCFGELFAKRCTACSKPITGIGGTRFISFEDRHWHNDCFICATCKTSLVGRGFITDADDIICPECAKQKLM